MNLQSRNKINASFSMSSMTDVIFLLLIFFMLTSSLTSTGLQVNLPSSASSQIVMQKVSVTINEDLQYFVNDKRVNRNRLEAELRNALTGEENTVVLNVDKTVPTEHLIYVAGLAAKLEAKVTVATEKN